MSLFKKRERSAVPPRHIAVIMDGNGRWAKKRGLPRELGHRSGAENFRRLAVYLRDLGVEFMTVFAFSTENWKRPPDEVEYIWELLREYLKESIEKMERDRVKLKILGRRERMPADILELIVQTDEKSKSIDGITLCVCVDYGGRDEILQAVRRIAAQCVDKNSADELREEDITAHLYTAGIPDPDLVIRTSGEYRTSNFLLWQTAYSEFYFTKTLFPDFGTREMDEAIAEYNRRERRFGGRKS